MSGQAEKNYASFAFFVQTEFCLNKWMQHPFLLINTDMENNFGLKFTFLDFGISSFWDS